MTQPNKINGLTPAEWERRCTGKHRWPDEFTARAGAAHAIKAFGKVSALYVYRCPHCRGWHLTRTKQYGQEPVRAGALA